MKATRSHDTIRTPTVEIIGPTGGLVAFRSGSSCANLAQNKTRHHVCQAVNCLGAMHHVAAGFADARIVELTLGERNFAELSKASNHQNGLATNTQLGLAHMG